MPTPVVLFRKDFDTEEEMEEAGRWFDVYELRSTVPKDSLVIARYSALPFYRELEADLANNGSRLLNSHREHDWIASFDWYYYLESFTPRSWKEYEFQYCDIDGPFVIKAYINGDYKPEPPVVNLSIVRQCESWSDLVEWENTLRLG